MNETRCHDCLDDFAPGARRFAVLKKMRDVEVPDSAAEPSSFFESAAMDAVSVCEACAGWYGDDALPMMEAR